METPPFVVFPKKPTHLVIVRLGVDESEYHRHIVGWSSHSSAPSQMFLSEILVVQVIVDSEGRSLKETIPSVCNY